MSKIHKVDREKFVDWAWTVHFNKMFNMSEIQKDLKGAGEHILDTRSILNRIGYVPGYLCEDKPIARVPAPFVQFIYKNPFTDED